jgi:hypothetical protein
MVRHSLLRRPDTLGKAFADRLARPRTSPPNTSIKRPVALRIDQGPVIVLTVDLHQQGSRPAATALH